MDYLDNSDLLKVSPSQKDGISIENEQLHRIFGCELIQEAGILLRQPQVVMATGQNMLHRFYYRKSLIRFDVFSIAMGCVMLASKVEEKPKLVREVVYIFHHIYQRRNLYQSTSLQLGGDRYNDFKEELLLCERHILKELGFSLYTIMDHPHKYLLYYTKLLNGSHELSQIAWNYLNDSMRLDLSLRYLSKEIACAAIYMSARQIGFPLPDEWWIFMTHNFEIIKDIAEFILKVYTIDDKIAWLDPLVPLSTHYLSPQVCRKYDKPAQAPQSSSSDKDILMNTYSHEIISTESARHRDRKLHKKYDHKNDGNSTPISTAKDDAILDSVHRNHDDRYKNEKKRSRHDDKDSSEQKTRKDSSSDNHHNDRQNKNHYNDRRDDKHRHRDRSLGRSTERDKRKDDKQRDYDRHRKHDSSHRGSDRKRSRSHSQGKSRDRDNNRHKTSCSNRNNSSNGSYRHDEEKYR